MMKTKKTLHQVCRVFFHAVRDTDGRGRTDTPEGTRF